MNKERINLRQISSFEECIPNIQHLIVEYFGKLVTRDYFEKKEKNEKKFEMLENTLKKDSIYGFILKFINKESSEKK